ncbi:polyamine ABC transporter substrate-binding protein [Aquariibacter albus]|uniref:Putrescine-binding periplasmic protein n=1 Tax=Aquariibacter albus TaxID=2759899 RepID=A0A839HJM1_9BURK|nr:polyamine ABC transporter substrate-binding protein [Aquariibacter albus]MBB1161152.1 polyamine ABC transporter substrate-binding protein [Aquariibacter albus]
MLRSAPRRTFTGRLAGALLAAFGLLAAGPAAAQEEKVLNVLNWSDYIAPDTIANFEKETGIKVRYDNFDSNEVLHAKLVAGKTGYDIVVPSSYWARVQADGGILQKLDKAKIPNLKNLDPTVQDLLGKLDPGNQFQVNWLWGYTTVGINVDKVKAALGGLPMPANVWDLIFKPEYISKLKSCGVSVLDSPTEVIPAALHYLGKPAYSRNQADYAAVGPLLKSIRPYITLFSSSGYINDMANGSICLALGWSGDISIARQRAIDGKTGQTIQTLVPATGGILFFDVMVIPADAPHPENAHKFIDYILRPEVHASLTNKVFYANPNKASKAFVKPEVVNNPAVFPSEADMKKMIAPDALSNDIRRTMTRLYTGFKTGL